MIENTSSSTYRVSKAANMLTIIAPLPLNPIFKNGSKVKIEKGSGEIYIEVTQCENGPKGSIRENELCIQYAGSTVEGFDKCEMFGMTNIANIFSRMPDNIVFRMPKQLNRFRAQPRNKNEEVKETDDALSFINLKQAIAIVNKHKDEQGPELVLSITQSGKLSALVQYGALE